MRAVDGAVVLRRSRRPTITMAILRKVATRPAIRIGSVVFNSGGPGEPGTSFTAAWALSHSTRSAQRTLRSGGFYPRGAGASAPVVSCTTDDEWDALRLQPPRSRTSVEVAAVNATLKARAGNCVARTGKAQGIDGLTFLA